LNPSPLAVTQALTPAQMPPALPHTNVTALGCERLPFIDFAQGALSSTGLRLDPSLNFSCNRWMALVMPALFHCRGGSRVNVHSRSPTFCIPPGLSAATRCLSRHLLMKALRRSLKLERDKALCSKGLADQLARNDSQGTMTSHELGRTSSVNSGGFTGGRSASSLKSLTSRSSRRRHPILLPPLGSVAPATMAWIGKSTDQAL
jgi:hypothetical protein